MFHAFAVSFSPHSIRVSCGIAGAAILAVAVVSAHAQPPTSREGSASTSPFDGNWNIEWHDYPEDGQVVRARATLSRAWEQVCVKSEDGGCRYRNRVVPGSNPLRLYYSIEPFQYGGNPQAVTAGADRLLISWGYGTLGGWGGQSTLRPTDLNELSGSWEYGGKTGREVWRRAIPKLDRVVFKGVTHFDYSPQFAHYDDPAASRSTTAMPGGTPGRVEGTWNSGRGWGPENDLRGNRPKFRIEIYGDNLWGFHLIDLAGAVGLEPLPGWRSYILENGTTTRGSPMTGVTGISADVVIWPQVRPGEKDLVVNESVIPFDLSIAGFPGAALSERLPVAAPAGTAAPPRSSGTSTTSLIVVSAIAGVGLANLVTRRRRSSGRVTQRIDVDAAMEDFEELQKSLRTKVGRDLAELAEFNAAFDAKWATTMAHLEDYMRMYPKLLPGLTALYEQQASREFAAKAAEWADFALSTALLGQGITKSMLGAAAKTGSRAARRADDLFTGRGDKRQPRRREGPLSKAIDDAVQAEPGRATKQAARDSARLEREAAAREARLAEDAATREARLAQEKAEREVRDITDDVNLQGDFAGEGSSNCYSCAMATDQRLAANASGLPAKQQSMALPTRGIPKAEAYEQLRRRYGTVNPKDPRGPVQEVVARLSPGRAARAELIEALEALGDGTRGIVLVSRNGSGHAFNVVNRNGRIVFIDSQSGRIVPERYWDDVVKAEWIRTDGIQDIR